MTSVERAVQTNLSILLSNAAGLRQGNPEAIHDARIATRRLRALVPIAMAALPDEQRDTAAGTLRRIGRTLGSARDLDVALQQLEGLDLRVPSASRAITSLRLTLMERQASARRQMVKRLEELPLDNLASVAGMRASPLRLPWRSGIVRTRWIPPSNPGRTSCGRTSSAPAESTFQSARTQSASRSRSCGTCWSSRWTVPLESAR